MIKVKDPNRLKAFGFKTAEALLNMKPSGIYSDYSVAKFYDDDSYILVKDDGLLIALISSGEALDDIFDLQAGCWLSSWSPCRSCWAVVMSVTKSILS